MAVTHKAAHKTVTNAVAAAGASAGLVIAIEGLRSKLIPFWGLEQKSAGLFGVGLTLGFVGYFWVWPLLLRLWRKRREPIEAKSHIFRLHPYDASDRKAFKREDGEHERILTWLRAAADPLLYLAGASGSGKSSLLHAHVLPELTETDKHVCIAVRGVNEPLQQIRRELLRADAVWQSPKDDADDTTAVLAHRAATHLSKSGRRMYIVFDQFEELLILHERSSPEVAGVLEFIRTITSTGAGSVPTVLLVMRSDYEGRVRELSLPAERMGVNKEVVRLVSEIHAEAFLERGGVTDATIRKRLVREASEIEETKGRLRFITLNFLGLAVSGAPGRRRMGRTGCGLLHGAVRTWVTRPSVREQADAVLRSLISDGETKEPLALAEVVRESRLPEGEAARVLMRFERDGLVRRHQSDAETWEISHDFVGRLLLRVLDDLRRSLLNRARPWLGAVAGTLVLLALAGVGTARYVRYDRALLAWQIAEGSVTDVERPTVGKSVEFGNGQAVTVATLRYLAYLPERRAIRNLNLFGASVSNAEVKELARPDAALSGLTTLDLSLTEVTGAGVRELARSDTGLKALTMLFLGNTPVTDAGVKELARTDTGLKALTTLGLWNTKVTDAGVKELARADTGLKALTVLRLDGTQVTDAGVKELARADTGIKALTTLSLWMTNVTDAGVRELARADTGLEALTVLYLSGTKVTDAGVKALARAETGLKGLTTLHLRGTPVADPGVRELARADTGLKALTVLDLSGTNVTDAGVKELARADTGLKALTVLNLSDTNVTDAGVKELARAETGLKALTVLDLSGTSVTDAGLKEVARADTGLKALTTLHLSGTKVTDAGVAAVKARFPGIRIFH
ncbi:MAG: hypothetical protein LW650_13170 [Planctomycetaceae bacterium]|jgi:Leucine-rich repeat (LRR) protein|nr:hypothetical protein [Planctomycetaceae bacterium]